MRSFVMVSISALVLLVASPVFGQPAGSFHLGPGDVLEISVWGDQALHREVVVRPDGKISFPLIGDVIAEGSTVDDLRAAVKSKVREYVPDAPVTVMLLKLGSQKVFVVGKVNQPGMYFMQGPLRVMQALAMAGGMTPFADTGKIKILREKGGSQEVISFDYDDVAKGKDVDTNVLLKTGDTIVVP